MTSESDRQGTPALVPINPRERIWAIDALRGLALFGVLAINLDTEFRRTFFEQFIAPPPMSVINRIGSLFLSYALEFKAISLFSLLFGVSLAIQYERIQAKGFRTGRLVRRLIVLLGFGLVHLYLIWDGDILTQYAIAGLLVVPFLLIETRFSLLAACALMIVFAALPLFNLGNIIPPYQDMLSHIEEAQLVYGRGSFFEILRFRIAEVTFIFPFLAYVFPRTLALMLFGSWLWRSGAIVRLGKNPASLLLGGIVLVIVGGMLTSQSRGDVSIWALEPVSALFTVAGAPLVIAFGYACLILAASGSQFSRTIIGWAVPVGRMAFSNYILQSLLLSVLFFGFGFGLMGKVGPAGGLFISIILFTVQSFLSSWWLRSHRFGPLEWAWRALTYGKRPQWRAVTLGS